jgi:hypothetical protein
VRVAVLKVAEKDGAVVGRAPNGDTVVEVRGGEGGPVLQTKNAAWQVRKGDGGWAVVDTTEAVAATIRRRMITGREIVLPDGETIKQGSRVGMGHGCRFGTLAAAKAPFVRPDRYFTLELSDELLARQDRELLIAVFTYLANSHIQAAIQVSATSAG